MPTALSWMLGADGQRKCSLAGGPEEGKAQGIGYHEVCHVENAMMIFEFLLLYRPENEADGLPYPYCEHFWGKRRRFEMRFQGRFKKELQMEDVYFGFASPCSLNLGQAASISIRWLTSIAAAILRYRGTDLLMETERRTTEEGEVVFPHISTTLLSCDAIHRTPEGETPPDIRQSFEEVPFSVRQGLKLNTTDTFTFVFWGKQLDFGTWSVVDLPFCDGVGFDRFMGDNPLYLVVYALRDSDKSHSQANASRIFSARLARGPEAALSDGGLYENESSNGDEIQPEVARNALRRAQSWSCSSQCFGDILRLLTRGKART